MHDGWSNKKKIKYIKESKWGYGGLNFLYIFLFFCAVNTTKYLGYMDRVNGKRYIYIRTGDFVICLGGYVWDLNKNIFLFFSTLISIFDILI